MPELLPEGLLLGLILFRGILAPLVEGNLGPLLEDNPGPSPWVHCLLLVPGFLGRTVVCVFTGFDRIWRGAAGTLLPANSTRSVILGGRGTFSFSSPGLLLKSLALSPRFSSRRFCTYLPFSANPSLIKYLYQNSHNKKTYQIIH